MSKEIDRREFLRLAAGGVAGVGLIFGFEMMGGARQAEAQGGDYGGEVVNHEEIERRIELYGLARGIPVFEYHGDEYNILEHYNMDQATFAEQMQWLADRDVHTVTGAELRMFVNGELDLPARSVILTTDSGKGSGESMPRMIEVLQQTGLHFHSFIWTKNMEEDSPEWSIFRNAVNSGHFTIGSHSEYHPAFANLNYQAGMWDLTIAKDKIENALGVEVRSIAWPHESVPSWCNRLMEAGYDYGFAGWSRPRANLAVYKNDIDRWSLPRILPPNPTGISGRPAGMDLISIMEFYNECEYEE